MFKIGEFSKIVQVSMRMLRHYDDIGLFKPAQVDRENGYRYYTAEQIPRLNRILALKDLGLSLDEIAYMMDDRVEAGEIRGMLLLKQAQLQQQVQEELMRLARVETRLAQIETEGQMPPFETVLKKIEPQRVLSIRETAPTFTEMGHLLLEGHEAVRRAGLRVPGFALFHDAQYEEQQVDWEFGFPVSPHFNGCLPLSNGRQMTVHELDGADLAAAVIYKGSYAGLHQGYSALGEWIANNGYQIAGVGREIFLRFEPQNPAQHITEILFPVKAVTI